MVTSSSIELFILGVNLLQENKTRRESGVLFFLFHFFAFIITDKARTKGDT